MIAPLLKDKKKDPGVVVIDDNGEHVISVLSGHLGGANELTHEVAAAIDARAVITTASDVQKTIPVDLFGRRFGWVWESADKLTPVSAAVVNEERIAVIQESGEPNWWTHERPIPANIERFTSISDGRASEPRRRSAYYASSFGAEEESILTNGVLYRPKLSFLE